MTMSPQGEQPQASNLSSLPDEQAAATAATVTEVRKQPKLAIERVQTGVRIEKRMLKVLKAVAEFNDQSLSQLLEEIILHSFEGEEASAFGPQGVQRIKELKKIYGMDYDVHASYRFVEKTTQPE